MPPSPDDLRVARITSLTLVNAMIFHQILASLDTRVRPLQPCTQGNRVTQNLIEAWTVVLNNIDYVPIFSLARDVVTELAGNPGIDDSLRRLAEAAIRITSRRAALRHDLMGRVYHRLLADAKYFGAYYTTIPAATLLLRLAIHPDSWETDWSNVEQIRALRICDLACGTGTLLKAALQTVANNHVKARAAEGLQPDMAAVHRALIEECLWGFDVIPFAIHLAGSALALHDPNITFGTLNLRTMLLGFDPQPRLGSLDFLFGPDAEVQADLLGDAHGPEQIGGHGVRRGEVTIPQLDLCVMNPPFTRSVGGNLLFGNLPVAQRRELQRHLRETVARRGVHASITAGLGSVFAAMAHQFIKPGGHLALVLPRALLSGVAWEQTRLFIATNYHVQHVIVSHQPRAWNFSENTSLSECLLVARRLRQGEIAGPTKFTNLVLKPRTSIEALSMASIIHTTEGARIDGVGVEQIGGGRNTTRGEILTLDADASRTGQWSEAVAFAQTELCRAAYVLRQEQLYIPGQPTRHPVLLIELGRLGRVGPDRRDIHDGFRVVNVNTAYAAFWGHQTEGVTCIAQQPNRHLQALARAQRGRSLRDAAGLWTHAGQLLVSERFRLNTARVLSIYLDRPVLSNTWWPVALDDARGISKAEIAKILVVWLNSTFGLLSIIGSRVDTEGAFVQLKKPTLESLRVLDPMRLSAEARRIMLRAYDRTAQSDLLRITNIETDAVRNQFDAAIAEALELPGDIGTIRHLLTSEPIFQRAETPRTRPRMPPVRPV